MRTSLGISTDIYSQVNRAIDDYGLIQKGDRILAAVSGGKDSLSLFKLLIKIRQEQSFSFTVFAAHIRTDFHCAGCAHTDILTGIFKEAGVEYVFRDIKVLDASGITNCFWCSWNKRKALFKIAAELSCNKLALGHHKDDIVETVLMNIFFNGELSAMCPRQELFDGRIIIIRPLCYVDEELTKKFALESGFCAKLCKCPFGKDSKRRQMKEMLREIQQASAETDIKTNIFNGVAGIKAADIAPTNNSVRPGRTTHKTKKCKQNS